MHKIYFFLLLISSLHCKPANQEKRIEDISNAQFTDTASLELHKDDRTIWQKPYEIINLLGPLEGKVIADIGAGSGFFSFRFIHTAAKVIAIDIEPKLIAMIDQEKMYYKPEVQSKLEARLATPANPMLEKNEVDIVFLSNTYVFIENRENYLRDLKNKFKADGRIMIVDFKKKLTNIGPEQKYRLAESDVEQELINAGYEILMSNDVLLDYQYVIIAKPKLF